MNKTMELFTGRVGFGLIRSPARFSRNLARLPVPFLACQRRLCFSEGQRLRIALLESYTRPSLSKCISKSLRPGGHNLSQCRLYSDRTNCPTTVAKPNIFQRMKQMTRDYWHVLLPVHVVTSVGWILIFYTAAKNSVDVIWIMEKLHFSEKYIEALRGSSAGYWAVAYALYKIFTPLRYMVTVGGTTLSIKHLRKLGYLKAKAGTVSTQPKAGLGKLGGKDAQRPAEPPKT